MTIEIEIFVLIPMRLRILSFPIFSDFIISYES